MAFGLSFFISAFCLEALVVVQLLSLIWLLVTPWTAACQGSLSFTISWSLLKFISIELVMLSNHLLLYCLLLLLPSIFPSISVFSNELTLHIRDQNIGASTWLFLNNNNLPMIIQGWFPLRLTGLISLQSKDSQESSPAPQFESISSSVLCLLYGPTLTSICDDWKNHSFDYMDLCQQSNVCFLTRCLGLSQLFFQGASVF